MATRRDLAVEVTAELAKGAASNGGTKKRVKNVKAGKSPKETLVQLQTVTNGASRGHNVNAAVNVSTSPKVKLITKISQLLRQQQTRLIFICQ
jgi:hypothetical protein